MECDTNQEILFLIANLKEAQEAAKQALVLKQQYTIEVENARNRIHKIEVQIKELIGLGKI